MPPTDTPASETTTSTELAPPVAPPNNDLVLARADLVRASRAASQKASTLMSQGKVTLATNLLLAAARALEVAIGPSDPPER